MIGRSFWSRLGRIEGYPRSNIQTPFMRWPREKYKSGFENLIKDLYFSMMNAPTDIQIINDADGNPAFVVIPYAQYVAQKLEPDLIPHEVVSRIVDGATPIRAWREHLNLTQDEVARRLGISQSAFAQQESEIGSAHV